MTDKTICRDDVRCEYAIQSGAEVEGHCPNGKCAMPQTAHLTIPGALEWDGDNGTHGADGESRAHGESAYTAVDMTTAAAGGFRDGQAAATDSLKAFASEMIAAAFEGGSFDGGDIQDIAVKHGLLQIEQRTEECGEVCACREYGFPAECYRKTDLLKPADEPAKCDTCGDWGHIETEDSAHDCPECGPSVVERAVEAGVMNAPAEKDPFAAADEQPYVPMTDAEIEAFESMGSGNKAKRRIAAIEAAKQKTCIECDQPYCHGVCVERGDQDYDRDQAAKGGCDE